MRLRGATWRWSEEKVLGHVGDGSKASSLMVQWPGRLATAADLSRRATPAAPEAYLDPKSVVLLAPLSHACKARQGFIALGSRPRLSRGTYQVVMTKCRYPPGARPMLDPRAGKLPIKYDRSLKSEAGLGRKT